MTDTIAEIESVATIKEYSAHTMFIRHPEASFGIFCYNDEGDLFLNSDYGFYGYAWRSYGDNFKEFLARTNADYIVGKFGINFRSDSGKKIPKFREEKLTILVAEFIKQVKKSL